MRGLPGPPSDEPPSGEPPAGGGLPARGLALRGLARGEEPSRLRDALTALGPLAVLVVAPRGTDVPLTDVVITEPGDEATHPAGALVLAIGVRGAAADGLVRAAGRDGATAVALRPGDGTERLLETAEAAGVALLTLTAQARWEQVETVAQAVVGNAVMLPGLDPGDSHGDLFSLAQTIATLTGGIVAIEDSANHVVAYSKSDDGADDMRRESILTRNCPERYLSVLREWGVYQRLRAGEEIVDVPAYEELGLRPRVVAAVRAGSRLLGTIWVQRGLSPLSPRTSEVLRGSARLAALHLVRYRGEASLAAGLREDLAGALIDGRVPAGAVVGHLGLDPCAQMTVIAIDPRAPAEQVDPSRRELRDARTTEIVSVYAAAYRQLALVTHLAGRVYLLLPETSGTTDGAAVTRWVQGLVSALRQNLGTPVQAAIARVVSGMEEVPAARLSADRMLESMVRMGDRAVATFEELHASVVLDEIVGLFRDPAVRDPSLDLLVRHDARHGTDLARSLLLYLDAFGDVAKVAEGLHVHPNTLRHRVRRAVALTGLDLADPDRRLLAMLQLRAARREP
ncbi:CdaR family transcriptional regulator [Actinocorallia herbida]|uniref:CdaR family transcriptional regulator n=1 Tax=Actinocorallia herbida TaxID=58109 RepID=A0A3N1CP02_9ACTN|nr:helix-turn-helix domain-containing protein [Actinocorallia herbida]ROO83003.1 CdaR family transcriptional regulator [Actinocorallia herbida]